MASRALGQDLRVGLELGHYRIVEKIGAGGMGEVYRASDEHLARDVAIKVLPPGTLTDESARKHFHKEALILSQLNHPNVATIHDFDTQQGVDFLVMEYIPGITLSEKVAGRPLPEKEVLRLGVQLAEGLSAAHEHGVIHRDLKPGNLRVTSDGRLKILDFGLAKLWHPVTDSAATESLSETQAMAGTVPYMAPEQLLGGAIDARTDLHAAGSVLYEMATGQRPFAEVEHAQLIAAILHRPPRPPTALNPQVSPELERIIGKCLEKDAGLRYQSAEELAIDLRRLQTGVVSAVQLAASSARWPFAKSVGLGLGILALIIVLLIAFNVGRSRDRVLGRTGAPRIESLAVLPLANLSGDPQQEYFADGMTEALTAELSQISSLKVISRTSVMRFKGVAKPLPDIARELGVDGIIEGSVLRSGDRVRITAQLIYAPSDTHLWAKSYERDLRDVLTLQREVSQAVANEIEIKLTPQEQVRLASVRPVNPEAYELYLKGRYHSYKRTEKDLLKAIEYFQQAAAVDPNYALAYAGLAETYGLLPFYNVAPSKEAFPKAKTAAIKAVELDDSLAEAHAAMGFVLFYGDWAWLAAERELKLAIELRPNFPTSHHWYAEYLSAMGRHEEAIAEIKRAQKLDPLSPLLFAIGGEIYLLAHRYDEAIEQCQKGLDLDPNYFLAMDNMGGGYVGKRMYSEAAAKYAMANQVQGISNSTGQAVAYALTGRRGEALTILRRLQEPSHRSELDSLMAARLYLALGMKKELLDWLERAYEGHEAYVPLWNAHPAFDPLRSEPRFQNLIRRMNFPQ